MASSICLVCRADCDGPLCSWECRRHAAAERARNAVDMQRPELAAEVKFRLASRNGQLTSGIIRYDTRT